MEGVGNGSVTRSELTEIIVSHLLGGVDVPIGL
jgi:hypothetical protein